MSLNGENTHIMTNNPISIDYFLRVNLKVGKILEAKGIRGMKKILKVKVDIGSEHREIAMGVAPHYKPDELVGDVISDGMILAADGYGGKPVLLTIDAREVPNGAMVR